ncbi:MAG: M23 family metallopeptidase [Cytophagaceae bacterium]|jgi:murein DD-endopeptidase MepM/ murein hydrolase activator NlpD|nr:M23 family metallopeptidase [Cytophagaceae bacterium]
MRKTITERLTTKYQIIVRNEENFADRWMMSSTLAKGLVFLAIALLLLFVFYYYLLQLSRFIFSGNDQLEERKALLVMMSKVDSLEQQLQHNDQLLAGWKVMMNGGQRTVKDSSVSSTQAPVGNDAADAEFVEAYEKVYGVKPYEDPNGFTRLYFIQPLKNGRWKEESGQASVVSNKPEAAVAISNATVLNIDTTAGDILLQHKEGLLTIYRSVKGILVRPKQYVAEGQVLSRPVNQKIHFEMWFRSRSLPPEDYISFPSN